MEWFEGLPTENGYYVWKQFHHQNNPHRIVAEVRHGTITFAERGPCSEGTKHALSTIAPRWWLKVGE